MKKYQNGELNSQFLGKKLTLYGWVHNIRLLGKLNFINLRDTSGIIQILIQDSQMHFNLEDVLEVEGTLVKRKSPNHELKTGAWELVASKVTTLNKAKELPFLIRDEDQTNEELRLKYRFLDLRKPKNQAIIKLRSKVTNAMREYLTSQDFIEIETPLLSKPTPEGARDYLVPTRKKGLFFSLPQSPQLYKQLLMASGFERYFQIARAFRDEDSRKDRQPEFTQLDIEMSFQNPQVLQTYMEKMFQFVFKKIGIEIKIPFQRMDLKDALENYGVDKPDVSYEYFLKDFKEMFQDHPFKIISEKKYIKGIFFDREISKAQFKLLEVSARQNKAKILFYHNFRNGEIKSGNFFRKVSDLQEKIFAKSPFSQEETKSLIIIAEDNLSIVYQALGALRIKMNEFFNFAKSSIYKFLWIVNWPMFEYDEEAKTYLPSHHAFTMYDEKSLVEGKLDFEKTRALNYDLVLNGFELGSGSVRINDFQKQKAVFVSLGMTEEEIEEQFGFFLRAFQYGLPPHCGIGLGLGRLIMILAQAKSLRDVIAFPKNAQGYDNLSESPSRVKKEQLEELFLEVGKS